jgi:hypothetical protein
MRKSNFIRGAVLVVIMGDEQAAYFFKERA